MGVWDENSNLRKIGLPVYPIRDIQGTVCSQGCQVMCGNSFRFARPLEHEELGENGDRLEEDRKRPEDLAEGEAVVENAGENETGTEEVFNTEGINGGVMCWPV